MSVRGFVAAILMVGLPASAAHAQGSSNVPVVGIITPHGSPDAPLLRAFRDRLRELGYVEGRSIELIYGFAAGDLGRMPALAAEMIQRRVTVLVTDGGPNPARAARKITSTIPIIGATLGGDPVGDGLVASHARPGGNVTGFTTAATDVAAKRLEYMKAGIPGLKHVGVLWNRGNAPAPAELTARAAEVLGMRATLIGLDLSSDLDAQITAAARAVDGLVLVPDGALFHRRRDVVAAVTRSAIPAIYPEREYVEAGGLMSYGPIIADNFRGAADYVDKVLRGAKVEELPVQDPARLELIINLRVARALALMITDVVLTRADEVIE